MSSSYGLPKKREQVLDALQGAYTNGNLEEVDFEQRVEEAYKAKTLEQLAQLIADFPAGIQAQIFPRTAVGHQSSYPGGLAKTDNARVLQVIFSEQKNALPKIGVDAVSISTVFGTQHLLLSQAEVDAERCSIYVSCYLGSTVIDLRNPAFADKHIDLYINGALGEIKIKVPKNVAITRNIQVVAGEFTQRDAVNMPGFLKIFNKNEPPKPDYSFSITIHGSFYLGSINLIHS